MDALDCIEKRIDNLNRILGTISTDDVATSNSETLTDSILSASTLLSSATSGRETINEFCKRSDELEKYLDPDFIEQQQDLRAKEVYLEMTAPELEDSFEQLEKIKTLESTLGAEYFRSIPDVTDKLKKMNESTADIVQQNDLLEESLTLAMQRYDEIQNNLKESLRTMNERIIRMEEKLVKKKSADE